MAQDHRTLSVQPRNASTPPAARGHLLLGNYLRFLQDPLRVVTETSRERVDIVVPRMLPWISTHLLTHPDGVEHMLKRNQKNYRKPSTFARPVATAAYPADEQLPPPWAELAGAGPSGHREEVICTGMRRRPNGRGPAPPW